MMWVDSEKWAIHDYEVQSISLRVWSRKHKYSTLVRSIYTFIQTTCSIENESDMTDLPQKDLLASMPIVLTALSYDEWPVEHTPYWLTKERTCFCSAMIVSSFLLPSVSLLVCTLYAFIALVWDRVCYRSHWTAIQPDSRTIPIYRDLWTGILSDLQGIYYQLNTRARYI